MIKIDHWDKIRATIKPYRPKASAKIKIKIIPTKIFSYYAFALTPASPTIPIANPAAFKFLNKKINIKFLKISTSELRPQHNPADKWA